MAIRMKLAKALFTVLLCLATAGLVTSCSGSDEEKAVNKAVEDLSGKTTVDTGNMLKKQINDLSDHEVDKVRRESAGTPVEDGSDAGTGK